MPSLPGADGPMPDGAADLDPGLDAPLGALASVKLRLSLPGADGPETDGEPDPAGADVALGAVALGAGAREGGKSTS